MGKGKIDHKEAGHEESETGGGREVNDAQYYTLIAVPLFGILLNGALFIYLGSRIDKVIDAVNDVDKRVAVLEDRRAGAQ